jgi:hypothetical protein
MAALEGVRPRRVASGDRRGCALFISAVGAAVLTAFPEARAAAPPVTGEQVRAAILRSVAHLKGQQKADGAWPDQAYGQQEGMTALVCWALLAAGVSPEDPALERGLATLGRAPDRLTYVVSLKALALASADPKRYRPEIERAAGWLVERQHTTGGWGYGLPGEAGPAGAGAEAVRREAQRARVYERTDMSNTQFAVLALAGAARAGAAVPLETWRRADRHLRLTQLADGGWGYVYQSEDPQEAYGSMTAAALAGLYLVGDRLAAAEPSASAADRAAAAEKGLQWIARRYTLGENPGRGLAWYYFWLYGLERLGAASGRRTFGEHDWFREGTESLVKGQRPDGSWTPRLYQNALALLFLAKGNRPLLVQRLLWEGGWREDPRDLEHLVRFLGTRVGGQAVAWQTVPCEAGVEGYLAAPILHIAGRGPLRMLAACGTRLKEYVQHGGLVLFDAQGGDAAFTESVRRLVADLFEEAALEPLPPNHPIYEVRHRVAPAGLETLRFGCRDAVLLAPKGLSDGWASGDPEAGSDALRLGENLAVYATGAAPLPDRLNEVVLAETPPAVPVSRGALHIGQVQHAGDWRPRPLALPGLLKDLPAKFGVSTSSLPVPVRLASPDDAALLANVRTFPILYIVGHYSFELGDKDRAALTEYLQRGGFLWAEACCGRKAFDTSFRALVAAMFPDTPLVRLPPDHPIFSGKVGYRIQRVAYSEAVRAESPDLQTPVLWGLQRKGHLAIVYSPYGIGVGLDGVRVWGARVLEPEDARRVATNIILYALTE